MQLYVLFPCNFMLFSEPRVVCLCISNVISFLGSVFLFVTLVSFLEADYDSVGSQQSRLKNSVTRVIHRKEKYSILENKLIKQSIFHFIK